MPPQYARVVIVSALRHGTTPRQDDRDLIGAGLSVVGKDTRLTTRSRKSAHLVSNYTDVMGGVGQARRRCPHDHYHNSLSDARA